MQTNIKHKYTMFAKEKWEGSTFLLAGRQCRSLDSGSLFIVLQFELAKFAGGFKKGLFSVFWRTWCFEIGKTNVDIADLVHFSNNGGIAGTWGQFADCIEKTILALPWPNKSELSSIKRYMESSHVESNEEELYLLWHLDPETETVLCLFSHHQEVVNCDLVQESSIQTM